MKIYFRLRDTIFPVHGIYSRDKLSSNRTGIRNYEEYCHKPFLLIAEAHRLFRRLLFALSNLCFLTSQIVGYQRCEQNASREEAAQRNVRPQIVPNVKQIAIERGEGDAENLHDRVQQTCRCSLRLWERELRGELEADRQIAGHEEAIKIFP